jgi:hypothetical protein
MEILIAGSKPNELIKPCPIGYFANASISTYLDIAKNCDQAISIVAGGGLSPAFNAASINNHEASRLLDLIKAASPTELFLTEATSLAEIVSEIRKSPSCPEPKIITMKERAEIIERISGTKGPIITEAFYHLDDLSIYSHLHSIAEVYRIRSLGHFVDFPHFFRPSTGIFTLLFAIQSHGDAPTYTLCGIGVAGRGVHNYHDKPNTTAQPVQGLYPHVDADISILSALAKHYRIQSTNPALCQEAGITFLPPDQDQKQY